MTITQVMDFDPMLGESIKTYPKPKYTYDDGGRAAAGFKGNTRDCVTRAIAIATERPYQEVYDTMNAFGKKEHLSKTRRRKSAARTGVHTPTIRKYMESIGWVYVPFMGFGNRRKTPFVAESFPLGRLVVNMYKCNHTVAVIDGVIHDTFDCSKDGKRFAAGYFYKP